jgi:hypothetical protein
MANHSYVHLSRKITVEEAERLLRRLVNAIWGPKMLVQPYTEATEKERRSWWVHLPGSELNEDEALKFMKPPSEPFGFLVWFHPSKSYWEFRHPMNNWEWWAQDKLQQEIARALGVKTYTDDGTATPQKVDPDALKNSYREYITRNFKQPYTPEDQRWFDSLLARAPEGFRE